MFKRIAMFSAAAALIGSSLAQAEPFNPRAVPEDAKWVLHVDVDALVKSSLWDLVEKRLAADPNAQAGLQQVEMATGIVFPTGIHSVMVVGSGFEDNDPIIVVNAKGNQEQLLGMMQTNPGYTSVNHGDRDVIGWEDKGKMMYGSFYSPDITIIAQNKENVFKEIDTLSEKSPAIKGESYLMMPGGGTNIIASIAGSDISALAQRDKNNPVLKIVKSGCITATQTGNDLVVKAVFNAGNERTAQQLRAMADGLKALGLMLANGENPDPKLKMIAPLIPGAQISSKGNDVLVDWTAPVDQVKSLIQTVIDAKTKGQ